MLSCQGERNYKVRTYQERFINVINYIEANLNENLDIERLCKISYLSKYHFHRQCSAFFGISVMALVKLLKLKRAAYQLSYRHEKKVLDIALANGYESHEAFSRAFKKHFKVSPSDFRKSPDWTLWHSTYDPILKLRIKVMTETANFNIQIVEFPNISLAALEHRGSPSLLGKSISKFIAWRKEHRLPPSKSRTFNLIYDDPSVTAPENYRFDVCCAIETPFEEDSRDIVVKSIPAGKCATIRHIGSDDSIGVAINYLYLTWLQGSGFEVRNFPLFLERVSFFPEVPENKVITDIYLPIE